MKNLLSLTMILLSCGFLSACDEPRSPFEVTQAFWYAVEHKNVDQIKQLVSDKSLRDDIVAENIVSVSNVSFGKIVIDGDQAEVETTVVVDSDQPATLPIDTLLVKENDLWKVDYRATMDAIGTGGQLSQLIRDLKTFGEKFSQEFESSMDEMDKAMPEIERGINDFGNQIKEHVPKIKKQIEEMTKELQRALEESLKEDEQQKSI